MPPLKTNWTNSAGLGLRSPKTKAKTYIDKGTIMTYIIIKHKITLKNKGCSF
jgi:hypothetical protein